MPEAPKLTLEDSKDAHVIANVQQGNKQAFNTLVVKYHQKIFKVISRYIKDSSEALDVTQEAFIKSYSALRNFRGDSSFYTWLYRISINTAKNHLIAQGRRLTDVHFQSYDMEMLSSFNHLREQGTPERMMLRDEIHDVVFEVINTLPSDLQTAFLLRERDGLSYERISQVMECPVGTVRSRIFRAREAIEKKVDPLMRT